MKALIIDDENLAALHLRELIKLNCDEVSEVSILNEASEVIEKFSSLDIDLLFLDMEMPVMSGFELLSKLDLKDNCQVIVVTAYDNYALEAYKNEAIAYLVKPVQADELKKVVSKAAQLNNDLNEKLNQGLITSNSKRLKVYDNEEYNLLDINSLVRLEANGNYTHLHTEDDSYVSTIRLGTYESQLADLGFFRIHRSHLINLNYLKKIGKASDACITLQNNVTLPISSIKRNELLSKV